jgi:hypothetical protein
MTPIHLPFTSDATLTPFLFLFLEVAQPLASEQTAGAETETETGDSTKPTKMDSVEDEDETGTDDGKD